VHNNLIFLTHIVVAGTLLVLAARAGRVWIVAFIAVCTVMMNIAVAKQMTLLGLSVTGGNVLFATVFLANDVINEHYGRQAARGAVLIGFAAGLAVLVLMHFVLWYAPNAYDDSQSHLSYFFDVGKYPRIVAASMLSYLLAQLLDVRLYDWIRRKTGPHRLLWLRSNASTWISQAFDTVFFTTAALTGTIIHSWQEWSGAVLFAYLIKILVAAADTPFLYLTRLPHLQPRDTLNDTSPA
jgi:hypothetical protein